MATGSTRKKSDLLNLFPDNNTQAVNPVDMRDAVESLYPDRYDVVGYGADNTGATDAAAAFTDAAGAAGLYDIVYVPPGTYRLDSTVRVPCSLQMHPNSQININHNGTGLKLGSTTLDSSRQDHRLSYIKKTTQVWAPAGITSEVGVLIDNMFCSRFSCERIEDFGIGLQLLGMNNRAVAYNVFHIGQLWDNAINLDIQDGGSLQYANANTFIGGRLTHVTGSANEPGVRQIRIDGANGNLFLGVSLEGNIPEYHLETLGFAWYNQFYNCRWEGSTPAVFWGADTRNNIVFDGYDAWRITESGGGVAPTKPNRVLNFSPGTIEVTGDRSDGTALTNLLTTLATMGFIVDSTTA